MRPCKLCPCDVHEPEPPSKSTVSPTRNPVKCCHSSLRSGSQDCFNGTKTRTSNFRSSKSKEIVYQLKGQLHRSSDHDYSSLEREYGALNLHRHCPSFTMHTVTDLGKEEPSRKVVEIICRRRWRGDEENKFLQIDKVFKVNNSEKSLTEFEEHREMVKAKASKLPMNLPRCMADGDEHLRFHCTTMACSLGRSPSRDPCTLGSCGVCRILSGGFSWFDGEDGVFTSGSGWRALESVSLSGNEGLKKALMVCRVVAGRVVGGEIQSGKETIDSGFDSWGGKLSRSSKFDDELFVLNPRAVLPCFVVTYKS